MRIQPTINRAAWIENAWLNRLQSLLLLAAMAGFMALLGWILWGGVGLLALSLSVVVFLFISPSVSPTMVMRLYGARALQPRQAPELFRIMQVLAERAGLPVVPTIYYVPSQMLNAFAVGSPRRSAIAFTDGLLRQLDGRELLGVAAHEMSHIHNNDLWVMSIADLVSRMTVNLSFVGQVLLFLNLPLMVLGEQQISWFAIVLLIFAPTISTVAQMALSRTREFNADLNAMALTGDPEGLASALAKLERQQGGWFEKLFAPGRRVPDPSLLRSHPETEERIHRLLSLKVGPIEQDRRLHEFPLRPPYQRVTRRPGWHPSGLWH